MNKKFLLSAVIVVLTSFFSSAFAEHCEFEQITIKKPEKTIFLVSCPYEAMLGGAGVQFYNNKRGLFVGKITRSRRSDSSDETYRITQMGGRKVEKVDCKRIVSEVSVSVKLFCELVSDKKVSGVGVVYSEPVETDDGGV